MRSLAMLAWGLLAPAFFLGPAFAADPTFANIAGQVGLAGNRPTQGDQPTFVYRGTRAIVPSNHGNPWKVMQLQGGVFKPIATILEQNKDGHGCTAADVTNPGLNGFDGLPDLVCTVGACEGQCTSNWPKRLWVQKSGGGFVDLSWSTAMTQPHARGRDTAVLKVDAARTVIAYANQASPRFPALSIDRAYLSLNGRITELPLLAATGSNRANTTGLCTAIVPRTGTMPDLVFCGSDFFANSYRWDGSAYRLTQPYGRFKVLAMLPADYDGDGAFDIGVVTGGSFTIRRNGVTPFGIVGLSRGVSLARGDVNCDGKPDVLLLQSKEAGNRPVMLLSTGGLNFRKAAGTFPHPSTGNGDSATYVPVGNGRSKAAFLISNGRFGSGPTYFVEATCH